MDAVNSSHNKVLPPCGALAPRPEGLRLRDTATAPRPSTRYAVLDLIGMEVPSWYERMQPRQLFVNASEQQLRVDVEERAHFAVLLKYPSLPVPADDAHDEARLGGARPVQLADVSGCARDERDAPCGAEEHCCEHLGEC